MQILAIFQELACGQQTDPVFEYIQAIRASIPPHQRTSRGIVWSLRQIRTQAQEFVPLSI